MLKKSRNPIATKKQPKYMELLPDFAWNPPDEIFYIERVIDWEDRIAHYPPKIKMMYREALSKRH